MAILLSSVRLPSDILVELGELTGHRWNSWELEPIICDAIRGYMNPAVSSAQERKPAEADAGYQWKQLFLPDGTRLRAAFGRVPYFAVVKGAQIKFGDDSVTPSGFANLQGSGNRNAWKSVWLRFPGNEQWVLADVCRGKQKIAISRLFGAVDGAEVTPQKKTVAAVMSKPVPGRSPNAATGPGKPGKRGKQHKHRQATGKKNPARRPDFCGADADYDDLIRPEI
nr:hypothetical protein [uncultured Duganella sp.]